MSPLSRVSPQSEAVAAAVRRLWLGFGLRVRDARLQRRWSVAEVSQRAGVSRSIAYAVEAGEQVSSESAVRISSALGLRAELQLIDPRKRDQRGSLTADPVHSLMGEFEARHFRPFRPLGVAVGIDEPYQHYQFAGRADFVAWRFDPAVLLHIENRTRFPDFQEMAGSFNAKRAYLGQALATRFGVNKWHSETHVIAALWSAEVLHAIRLRTESFKSLCPDPPVTFAGWWRGDPPGQGSHGVLVVLDPLASGRERNWVGLEDALKVRPRHSGYAETVAKFG